MLEKALPAVTHDGFPSASIALCLALCSGCPSGQSFVDVLCPTSGYMEFPNPSKELIRNTVAYVDEAWKCAEEMSG